MDRTSTVLPLLSGVGSFVAMIANAVAFGTEAWLVSKEDSPFLRIGFHKACFEDCRHPFCPSGDPTVVYNGCYWVHNHYYNPIRSWLLPSWFINLRNAGIATIPLSFICMVLGLVIMYKVIRYQYHIPSTYKRKKLNVLLFVSSALMLLTGMILMVMILIFAYHVKQHDWMPMPARNTFGYSFYLEVVTCALMILGAVFNFLSAVYRILLSYNPVVIERVADDMVIGHAASRYEDSGYIK